MKLFAFQPNGHGELSFFVMAESEEAARESVDAYIKANLKDLDADNFAESDLSEYAINGWGTPYYRVTAAEAGEVVTNDND